MAIQKILFGSPGTGKSYKIREIASSKLRIKFDESTGTSGNVIKSVFHPEYTYSDFMGKLLPLTSGSTVIYKYYPGHFLRALGKAYRGIIEGNSQEYLLVIDELNRGNSAAIFGSIFQLLDRENDGWSSYEIDISDMELIGLLNAMGYSAKVTSEDDIKIEKEYFNCFLDSLNKKYVMQKLNDFFECHVDEIKKRNQLLSLSKKAIDSDFSSEEQKKLQNIQEVTYLLTILEARQIKIPPNLSIIATINTSDESIYYIDSAFKRRWDWEYINTPSKNSITSFKVPEEISKVILTVYLGLTDYGNQHYEDLLWYRCIVGINEFIKSNYQSIRKIEDKQLGWWFVKPQDGKVTIEQVKHKIMFYLWDSVFARDKKPLEKLFLSEERFGFVDGKIISYADFVLYAEEFMYCMHNSVTNLRDTSNIDNF